MEQRRNVYIVTAVAFSFVVLLLINPLWPARGTIQNGLAALHIQYGSPEPIHGVTFGSGCRGPRGSLIDDASSQDLPAQTFRLPGVPFPDPMFGSYDILGLEKSWMTFDQRYGPYGYGEERRGYDQQRVDWANVDWGSLQDQCLLEADETLFDNGTFPAHQQPVFRLYDAADPPVVPPQKSHGQAIVLRAYEGFKYTAEDMWSIRALISEAALATKGQYSVFLLVNVKRKGGGKIHHDDEYYREVLQEIVPKEFWNIAVLFHRSLLKSWYSKVGESRVGLQVMQALELFAHFYPQFDHYWQFEMDTRFTGHVGNMLQAFDRFGRVQPYKQARERSSWAFLPELHNTWEEFSAAVNQSLGGGASFWGPMDTKLGSFETIGEKPPTEKPQDDDFQWGVGTDADLLLLDVAAEYQRFKSRKDSLFRDWFGGVEADVPRFVSTPGQLRASRRLLESVHKTQHELGTRLASESVIPTIAFWNGLKVVTLPLPKFQFPTRPVVATNMLYNGGEPQDFSDGIAEGLWPYQRHYAKYVCLPRTYEWHGPLPDAVYQWWEHKKPFAEGEMPDTSEWREIPNEMPPFLAKMDGMVYVPSMILHPRKTNPKLN